MTAPTDDTTGTLTRTEAETSTEIAARPAPAADASLEARAAFRRMAIILPHLQTAARDAAKAIPGGRVLLAIIAKAADGSGRITCDFESAEFLADLETLVRAVDASRPGLTEEQAREIAADVATSFNARWSIGLGQGPLKDMADRIEVGVLRASRGETGPARVDTVWTGISVIARPAPDPRATLRAGDPASPFAPGSLAAGSATEDRILDRKRGGK